MERQCGAPERRNLEESIEKLRQVADGSNDILAESAGITAGSWYARTRQPDGMQAWKIVIPSSKVKPEPRAHDGHEWIYVLSGQMRLILGDQNWVLGPGEVAEFDTAVPHWFGSTGQQPVEILSIFTRPGERMSVRTTPPQS